ncbi:hypothetical protein, partial [Herpetosiphon llansteffanensis]|uniref:hypothetical protein n=1 Tax=Herpetosiphon llansteffanensis TaxID=2094568 RepID=UPI00196B7784
REINGHVAKFRRKGAWFLPCHWWIPFPYQYDTILVYTFRTTSEEESPGLKIYGSERPEYSDIEDWEEN